MRCLACEIHLLVRMAMRFRADVIAAGVYLSPIDKIVAKYGKRNVHVDWENDNNRFPAIATMIVDVQVPNSQKRTTRKVVKEIKALIDGNLLEEGFIETHEASEVFDLLPMEKDMKKCVRR